MQNTNNPWIQPHSVVTIFTICVNVRLFECVIYSWAGWAWARHEVGWLKIRPQVYAFLIQKSLMSPIFVKQELDDEGGERLLGHECLLEWIRYSSTGCDWFGRVLCPIQHALFISWSLFEQSQSSGVMNWLIGYSLPSFSISHIVLEICQISR